MTISYRVLTGPTAAGKTALLLERARRVPLSIISADSRQVYRGMDIGTGKASLTEQQKVPHCCIDLLEPSETFSAYDFMREAARVFATQDFYGEVWVCGGTGLYIRALTERLQLGRAALPRLRERLNFMVQAYKAREVATLLGLSLRDPDNPVRVVRRAELSCDEKTEAQRIYALCGLEAADLAADKAAQREAEGDGAGLRRALGDWRRLISRWRCSDIAVLDPGREALHGRIEQRVRGMFEAGLVAEVEQLRAEGYGSAPVVLDGIGYSEAGMLLDHALSESEAIERTIVRTRQYAKRQRTYFRGMGWRALDSDEALRIAKGDSD